MSTAPIVPRPDDRRPDAARRDPATPSATAATADGDERPQAVRSSRPAAGARPRLLIYAGDVLGLGHLRRNLAIAARVVELAPGTDVLILTNLPSVSLFEPPRGVDVVKLPSIAKLGAGLYGSQALGIGHDEVLGLRADIIATIVERYEPQLLLVDHLPTGVAGELLPALRSARARRAPPRAILGLRDILDDPQATRRQWERWRVYETIDALYDEVLVYGSRELFETAAVYGLREAMGTPVTYCGHVAAPPVSPFAGPGTDGSPARIVVTAGGGADGHPILSNVVDALCRLPRARVDGTLVVAGPFMRREQRDALRARGAEHGIAVTRFEDDLPRRLAAADLVITMAGYNTLGEVVRLGRRSLVIPRPGPSAEQRLRARLYLDRGLITRVADPNVAPGELATLINASLDVSPPRARLPEPDGLESAARAVARALAPRASEHQLAEVGP